MRSRCPDKTNLLAATGLSVTNQGAGTNHLARRPRFNEAELVRERREGVSEADLTALRDRELEKPTVQDPALARALDLLRGWRWCGNHGPDFAVDELAAATQVQRVNAWLNEDDPFCLHRERVPQPDGRGHVPSGRQGHGEYQVCRPGWGGRGLPPSAHAVQAVKELGIDISVLRSRMLTTELVEQADYILA